jgi:hypothetical protein
MPCERKGQFAVQVGLDGGGPMRRDVALRSFVMPAHAGIQNLKAMLRGESGFPRSRE